jgi:CubicO group peptidase (beta-lactamase class C family)
MIPDPATQIGLGFDPERLRRIDGWMADHVASRRLAGLSFLITRKGEVAYRGMAGMRDAQTGEPVSRDTIWRIYSMTKPITTLAALMLYEEGAFQLDQPVADFIPSFGRLKVWKGEGHSLSDVEDLERPVTIHDLMTHQSGLIYDVEGGNALEQAMISEGLDFSRKGDRLKAAMERLTSLPLAFQPGARWHYGVSTDVLGRIVEVISGVSLASFFQERIFAPLGMSETGFFLRDPALKRRLAAIYGRGPEGFQPVPEPAGQSYDPGMKLFSGGGGLLSTLDDYQKFASMLLSGGRYSGGRLIGRKTFDLMTSNHMGGDLASRGQSHFAETTFHGIGFGLGLAVMLDPAKAKILGSAGEFNWGGMASTTFWVDPAEELTAILMTQLYPSSTYTLRRQLRVLTYQALV